MNLLFSLPKFCYTILYLSVAYLFSFARNQILICSSNNFEKQTKLKLN
jgi:hypothetical protein